MPALPQEAIISVTNRCDARCRMCNIWQLERDEHMTAEDYRKLPPGLRNVNITGGEPLLRPDILEIVHAVHEAAGNPRIILATNGFRPEATLRQVQSLRTRVPKLGIAVSLDGLADMHDHMRGVRKSYARAVATLKGLRQLGITDLRIGFTATAENIRQLPLVRRLAEDLGVEFAATVAHNSDIYYATQTVSIPNRDAVLENFRELVDSNLRSHSPKRWLRAYFEQGVIDYVKQGVRASPCTAATDFFFLSPRGDVYPCLVLPEKLGNLREQPFEAIWNDALARRTRRDVGSCQGCWMVCSARTAMRREPLRIASWVARRKLVQPLRRSA
jgi:MoaA/NifB/PqqE/SkfB family radical SAM enzyme